MKTPFLHPAMCPSHFPAYGVHSARRQPGAPGAARQHWRRGAWACSRPQPAHHGQALQEGWHDACVDARSPQWLITTSEPLHSQQSASPACGSCRVVPQSLAALYILISCGAAAAPCVWTSTTPASARDAQELNDHEHMHAGQRSLRGTVPPTSRCASGTSGKPSPGMSRPYMHGSKRNPANRTVAAQGLDREGITRLPCKAARAS